MKFLIKIAFFSLISHAAVAQITPDEAVRAALQTHPTIKAAAFGVEAKKYGEKTALNLPNPEINAESPTGTFYAVGILQSFEFPTVYVRQKQVAKAETALARAGQRISENDLRYAVRNHYLEVQTAEYQSRQWAERDSLYAAIAAAAVRQFNAGEIDFLQKTLTENEAGKVHQEHLAALQTEAVLRQQLAVLTGLPEIGALLPLVPDTAGLTATPDIGANPNIAYEQQVVQVAERQISLARSRALPSFSLGYLNQGESGTPLDYRFRASVGVPLWAGQYQGGRQAAQSEAQAAKSRADAQAQNIAFDLQNARSEASIARNALRYQEQEGLPRSRALIDAATRMREAGQVDYVTYLRILDEAFAINRDYIEQVQEFNAARLRVLYLTGQ